MKKLFFSVVALVLLMPNLASADQIAVPQQERLSSINKIKEYVLTNRDVNVMLYDENGNILNEFHGDLIIKFLMGHKLLKIVIPNHHHLDTQ